MKHRLCSGGFYVTDCYVIPTNEGDAATSGIDGGYCRYRELIVNTKRFSYSGDCLWEVLAPTDLPGNAEKMSAAEPPERTRVQSGRSPRRC